MTATHLQNLVANLKLENKVILKRSSWRNNTNELCKYVIQWSFAITRFTFGSLAVSLIFWVQFCMFFFF